MRFIAMAISALVLSACSPGDITQRPTAPEFPLPVQPSGSHAFVWAMAIDASGVCIAGATATVVRGQGLGRSIVQTMPCDAWDYDGGFMFNDLAPGVAMSIRVSALGYAFQERTVVPSYGPSTAVFFELTRIP